MKSKNGGTMKTLSVRGVDEELAGLIKQGAEAERKSVNAFVLDALREQLGAQKPKRFAREWHDLDDLFGRWSDQDYADIQGKIDEERQIDEELWK
jgi:hypothetical protein